MNKEEIKELADRQFHGVQIGDFIGMEGVDETIDRKLLVELCGRFADRLGAPNGPNGKTVLDVVIECVPNIVRRFAKAGYLTPDEILGSPACNVHFQEMLQRMEEKEAEERAARQEAIDRIKEAKLRAEEAITAANKAMDK